MIKLPLLGPSLRTVSNRALLLHEHTISSSWPVEPIVLLSVLVLEDPGMEFKEVLLVELLFKTFPGAIILLLFWLLFSLLKELFRSICLVELNVLLNLLISLIWLLVLNVFAELFWSMFCLVPLFKVVTFAKICEKKSS